MYFKSPIISSILLVFLIGIIACQPTEVEEEVPSLDLPQRPNILWLVTEDMGPYIPSFGDSTIVTPNLSWLAGEGVRYPHLFSPSGVCAPSRAAIATGMYPSSIGANHMRTTSYTDVTGLPSYEAVPPPEVRMFSQLMREGGYYCTNNLKQDYQFQAPATAWDENGPYAHWRNRGEDQPFFSIFNFTTTHESGLFEPYGFRKAESRHYRSGDTSYHETEWKGRTEESETPVHVSKDLDFPIPPYLPDNEVTRRDMWKLYNNIAEMDQQVGAILDQLKEDDLLENTIIFFYGDHGGPLPRQKRLIYDSGLNTPMIIRFPHKQLAGTIDDQLVSFIDFAPTVLTLAGLPLPSYLQGQSFLSEDVEERKYIHAAADRFDGFTDAIRAVRDKQYKYIRNYRTDQGYYLPITYRERIPTMQELLRLRDEGQLNEIQAQWFREEKPAEELFDCINDPNELVNLADNPDFEEKLRELRIEMDRWIAAIGDQPNLPEAQLISQLWSGADEKPVTSNPIIEKSDGKLEITCNTIGASVGYQIVSNDPDPQSWRIYQEPLVLPAGTHLRVRAHRIGFVPSETIQYEVSD